MSIKQINKKQLTPAPPVGHSSLSIVTQQQKQQRLPTHLFLHKGEKHPVGPQELQGCLTVLPGRRYSSYPLPFSQEQMPTPASEDGGRGCLLGGRELGPLILTLSGIGALGFHRKTVFEHIWSDSRGM